MWLPHNKILHPTHPSEIFLPKDGLLDIQVPSQYMAAFINLSLWPFFLMQSPSRICKHNTIFTNLECTWSHEFRFENDNHFVPDPNTHCLKKSMWIMVLAEDEQVVEYGENGWEMISGKSHKMGIPKSHVSWSHQGWIRTACSQSVH
jgi:hypothetical protein